MLAKLYDHRFSILLASLTLLLLIPGFIEFLPYQNWIEKITQIILLLACLNVIRKMKRWVVVLVLLAFFATVSDWLEELRSMTEQAKIVSLLLVTIVTSVVTYELFHHVAGCSRITLEILVAAISGYLLMAFIGSLVYLFIEMIAPGSFFGVANDETITRDLIYFSFATQMTIGYGDMIPISSAARTVAVIQGLVGQFYMVIVMAVLISKYIQQNHSQS